MCCFSRPVKSVTDTNIFARSAGKERQFIVYSMKLNTESDLAMILPLPTPKGSADDSVKFISFEKYPKFFDDLDARFPKEINKNLPRGGLALGGVGALPVVQVGSFVASFVPSVKDFARLDDIFRLPAQTWDALPQYNESGFAVFQLKKGEKKIHPMAFDFPRANPKKLFFPTVHIHDGKVHEKAGFDHTLYAQASAGEDLVAWNESPQPAELFMKKLKEIGNVVDGKDHVYRKRMIGMLKNEDLYL
jgi:hypothetical protein